VISSPKRSRARPPERHSHAQRERQAPEVARPAPLATHSLPLGCAGGDAGVGCSPRRPSRSGAGPVDAGGYWVLAVNFIASGPQLLLKPPAPVRCWLKVIAPVAFFAVLNLPVTIVVVTVFVPAFVLV